MENNLESFTQSVVPFELQGLAEAVRYQQWIYRSVEPYLGSRILELGAGIGNMSKWMPLRERLILTEMDPSLLPLLQGEMDSKHGQDPRVSVLPLDLSRDDVAARFSETEKIDTIVSFNVLEHIEDDGAALARLCEIMRRMEGVGPRRIVTFVPAHSWAFGSMDRTFHHFRRYSARGMRKLCAHAAPEAQLTMRYFNVVGLLGWVVNGRLFKKVNIGKGSIRTFEGLCPLISPVDDFIYRAFRLPFGQSLLAVLEWK